MSENREVGNVCVRACVCVCVNLRAKMRDSVLDKCRSRIFLALLIGSNLIWHINLNAN